MTLRALRLARRALDLAAVALVVASDLLAAYDPAARGIDRG